MQGEFLNLLKTILEEVHKMMEQLQKCVYILHVVCVLSIMNETDEK